MTIRVLLLQVRNADDPMRDHEHHCFVERSGIPRDGLVAWDVVHDTPTLAEVRAHDALMIGGSGDYYVSKRNQPGLPRLLGLLQEVVGVGHPTFASCYGFQCMVTALGGEIIHDPDNTEVGTFDMELTDSGVADPLLGRLPPRFTAQQGHKDRASRLPDGFLNLARSERAPIQAFRVPDKPIWGAQFHPELDHLANRTRYEHYLDAYSQHLEAEERERALDGFRPSPHASSLLREFLTLI